MGVGGRSGEKWRLCPSNLGMASVEWAVQWGPAAWGWGGAGEKKPNPTQYGGTRYLPVCGRTPKEEWLPKAGVVKHYLGFYGGTFAP